MRVLKIFIQITLVVFALQVKAQDKLTEREKEIIRYDATLFIEEFEQLLNTLASPNLSRLERDEIISNSYSTNANQIFKDGEVIIEDDINPNNLYKNTVNDLAVKRYLNDLDLFYSKSSASTIDFTEAVASEVKQKDYIYLEVYFKSTFIGSHSISNRKYKTTDRVATIIAVREGEKWDMQIASVVFYKPDVHTFVKQQKVENLPDSTIVTNENLGEEILSDIAAENKFESNWELGVFVGFATNTGLAPGLKVRWNIAESFGLQAGFNYFIKGDELIGESAVSQTAFEVELNGIYNLPIEALDAYLLAGINYLSFEVEADYDPPSIITNNHLGVNLGFGVGYTINDTITPFLEAKYVLDNQLLAGVGVRFAFR